MKKLLLTLALLFCPHLAAEITFISSDKIKFDIPDAVAKQSAYLEKKLDDTKGVGADFDFLGVSSKVLGKIVDAMKKLHAMQKSQRRPIEIIKELGLEGVPCTPTVVRAVNAIIYEIEPIYKAVIREYVKPLKSQKELPDFKKLFPPLVIDHIAEHYVFVHGENMKGFQARISLEELYQYSDFKVVLTDHTLKLGTLPISSFQGLSHFVLNAGTLTSLTIKGPSMKFLAWGAFANLRKLKFLDLQNNNLESLEAGAFSRLLSLKSLRLHNNKLERIEAGAFSDLINLEHLHLHNNKLERIEAGVFSGLLNLEFLHLHNNKLERIEAGAFSDLPNFGYLDLHDNKLESLEAGVFSRLWSLKSLHLYSNQLSDAEKSRIRSELPDAVQILF